MSEKCELVITKEKRSQGYCPVFIGFEAHAKVKAISSETGIPMNRLVERFIDFATSRLAVVEEDE